MLQFNEINPSNPYGGTNPMNDPSRQFGAKPTTPPATPAEPVPDTKLAASSMSPELEQEVDAAIDGLGQQLGQVMSATGPGNSAMKNLPWFGGGARGFLRKLWYGNSPENPDWSNWAQKQGDQTGAAEVYKKKGLTLKEYTAIDEQLEVRLQEMISEATGINPKVDQILQQFKQNIKAIILKHMTGGAASGTKTEPEASGEAVPADTNSETPPERTS